jgi:lipopolysaccharide export system protein LptA
VSLQISHLRRWFVIVGVLALLVVAGAYFYARYRVENALKKVPDKIGLDIQQSAEGFTVSKSEQGHTLFKVQASKAVQFKQGGLTELHDVTITVYGRDSSRFDQIYGADFEYQPQTGDVTAKGPVQIDLEANPSGVLNPDQAAPKELKNPIHLRTSGLTFNQKTGNAFTREKIEFSIPQASGSAVGATYAAKTRILTLESQIRAAINDRGIVNVTAARGTMTKDPREVTLLNAQVDRGEEHLRADTAKVFLRPDNTIERITGDGNVEGVAPGENQVQGRADHAEAVMEPGREQRVREAAFSGSVRGTVTGKQSADANAGVVHLLFAGQNVLKSVRASEGATLVQHQTRATGEGESKEAGGAQDVVVKSAAMLFSIADGRRLERAETDGPAEIDIVPPQGAASGPRTAVTAVKFTAAFDPQGKLASVHGAPRSRIVNSSPGQPDRVSTADALDAVFLPGGGIGSLTQQGKLVYHDGERKAWGARARYTPADQMLVLTGAPRVEDGGMLTTADRMRLDRATGDAFADGNVKSTYNELKANPQGAMLASSSPIHVTSNQMVAHKSPSTALYTGEARLWQDANVVKAPSIEFDQDRRMLVAQGQSGTAVSTVLVQPEKNGKSTPVVVTSPRLTYSDNERRADFEGGVMMRGGDLTITADKAAVYLLAGSQVQGNKGIPGQSRLDKIVADGHVVVVETDRRATGDTLVYTAADDKFVLTGGPPSIFDAEHGKITGVSLTFYRADDRVLVEGRDNSPTVTHTRVAR